LVKLLSYKAGNDNVTGYLLLAPAFVFMAVFALTPIVASLFLGFFKWPVFAPPRFIGLGNFTRMFGFATEESVTRANDPKFWQSLVNNAVFLIQIPVHMAWSLGLALLINRRTAVTYVYRSIFFLPVVSAMVAVAVIWRWIYQPSFGLMNTFLKFLGVEGPDWLGDIHWAKPSVMLMNLWKNGGYQMLIYLAALQGVPDSFYEAADIEGAGSWQKFWRITFPMISATNFFLLVMGVIWSLQMFPQIFVLTKGGPAGYTTTMVYYIYLKAFEDFQMGYSSAMAMILFLIIISFTLLQWNLRKRWVHGEEE
jgi:multiple sugar transport system permease protein